MPSAASPARAICDRSGDMNGRQPETAAAEPAQDPISESAQRDPAGAHASGAAAVEPLTVSHGVVVEMVRVAALEVPGVLKVSRGGPLAWLAGAPVPARVR